MSDSLKRQRVSSIYTRNLNHKRDPIESQNQRAHAALRLNDQRKFNTSSMVVEKRSDQKPSQTDLCIINRM